MLEQRYSSVAESAAVLRIGVRTLRKLRAAGELPQTIKRRSIPKYTREQLEHIVQLEHIRAGFAPLR